MLYYLTYPGLPNLPQNEIQIVEYLRKHNIEVHIIDWHQLDVSSLCGDDVVLLRSTWDYDLHPSEFRLFLEALSTNPASVFNHPNLMLWNMDKRYMLEFQEKGLPVIPTFSKSNATEILEYFPDTSFIIAKPVFSAGARGLIKYDRDSFLKAEHSDTFIYQPFVPSVPFQGEWSLLYVDGIFSHAVLKQAKSGDFRVQSDYGGTYTLVDVPEHWITIGYKFLNACKTAPFFARVDMVLWEDNPVLIELEVIEPELFLLSDAIIERWAETILRKVSSRNELAQTRTALSGN